MDQSNIDQRYLELAERWMNGSITAEEEKEFSSWYESQGPEQLIVAGDEQSQRLRMLFRIREKAGIGRAVKKLRYRVVAWSAAAAALVGIVTAILVLSRSTGDVNSYANDVKPGGNKAYLTLQDGRRIALSSKENRVLKEDAGVKIRETTAGQLVYEMSGNPGAESVLGRNTLETPKGGQYRLVLPDQTVVWLNAASAITFPVSFANLTERSVHLTGEAYFEVAKDPKRPFLVISGSQEIKVLGTHFNVNAYADEPVIKTTLLEGSIELNRRIVLKPGEQGTNNGKSIRVEPVHTEYATAWKDGKFRFYNENIKTLMRIVARWYDVEVVYQGDLDRKNFSGIVSRFGNVSELLRVLESTNTVHFKVEGRRITVMQ